MEMEDLIIEESKKVYSVTLNRPNKLNAINSSMMRGIKKSFEEAEENEKIQLILLKSAKCRAFSTGFDTNELMNMTPEQKKDFFNLNHDVASLALSTEKLILTEIQGFAVAAGFALCLFADFRLVVDDSKIYFALPEIAAGIFPYTVLALSLYHFPPSIAMSLLFSGRKLSLQKADQFGFIHRIFQDSEYDKQTKKFIRSITTQNKKVQRMAKVCFNLEREQNLNQIRMEKDFTQTLFDENLNTKTEILRLRQKWSRK
jgi:enoyl-CoA hydratase/carnithine racemase